MSDFRNNASQGERASVLKNDWKTSTLQGRAVTELLMEERGRYAKPVNVTAAENAPVAYKAADWTREHTGDEPPLGQDVNAVEPVGEHFEVRTRPTVGSSQQTSGDSAREEADAGRGVVGVSSSPSTTPSKPKPWLRSLK